jgi:hypothetical protein
VCLQKCGPRPLAHVLVDSSRSTGRRTEDVALRNHFDEGATSAPVADEPGKIRTMKLTRRRIDRVLIDKALDQRMLFYVPCYSLPRVHEILARSPHAARMDVQPNYAAARDREARK